MAARYARTKREFYHNFGAGALGLSVVVEAGSLCRYHPENKVFYVLPGQVPVYAQHDANYRGIPVPLDNLELDETPAPAGTLLGEIVEKDGAICLQVSPRLWYPLEGSSAIAAEFRESFNHASKTDLGRRLYRQNGVICMESIEQANARRYGYS